MSVTSNKAPELDEECVVVDSKDGLTGTFTKFADGIFEWCAENGVDADLITKWSNDYGNYSAWRIKDPKQRTLFVLRWG